MCGETSSAAATPTTGITDIGSSGLLAHDSVSRGSNDLESASQTNNHLEFAPERRRLKRPEEPTSVIPIVGVAADDVSPTPYFLASSCKESFVIMELHFQAQTMMFVPTHTFMYRKGEVCDLGPYDGVCSVQWTMEMEVSSDFIGKACWPQV
ncbi:unnamed protein product [Trifolium pratense]|uniref:Uncharacterized protein n=1 Tax=Trifolium pratense TaxID=57577 RepID=A0ACB0MCZ5_TRIPR|nr:unnamed protein product [Trifolium pratense]